MRFTIGQCRDFLTRISRFERRVIADKVGEHAFKRNFLFVEKDFNLLAKGEIDVQKVSCSISLKFFDKFGRDAVFLIH